MAPSSGNILVPKVLNALRYAVSKTAQAVRSRLSQAQQKVEGQAITIPIHNASRHALHPLATLRQSRSGQTRGFATSIRAALTETYPSLRTAARNVPSRTAILARAPTAPTFGSALRPRLTGGALPRTAGGYVAIGGRRAFSHVPNAQAQVLANVSAGVRAFWIGGQRAKFDGVDQKGRKRFIAVGTQEEKMGKKVRESVFDDIRGTSLEFCVAPELAALKGRKSRSTRKNGGSSATLTSAVAPLATDFARSLGVLAAVHRDLKLLSKLGDLPISEPRPGWIAVRFPGCDGKSVERLCDELGVCRGIIREDESWAEEASQDVKMALLFPTAPSDGYGERDYDEYEEDDAAAYFYNPPGLVMPESLMDASVLEGGRRGSDDRFTTEETLSPLESIHGSVSDSSGHARSYEHVSRPSTSWQPNPWTSGENRDSGSSKSSRDGPRSFQGVTTESQEVANIYQFIAECDGWLGARY